MEFKVMDQPRVCKRDFGAWGTIFARHVGCSGQVALLFEGAGWQTQGPCLHCGELYIVPDEELDHLEEAFEAARIMACNGLEPRIVV